MIPTGRTSGRRRRALPHQCRECRRHWALEVVHHPAGVVVVCRYCLSARAVGPLAEAVAAR